MRGQTPVGYPYSAVPPDFLEHCRILEEYKSVPFSQWNVKAIVAWMESGLGALGQRKMVWGVGVGGGGGGGGEWRE